MAPRDSLEQGQHSATNAFSGRFKDLRSREVCSQTGCTRPELALELIHLVAHWFPDDEIMVTGDSAYGGASILRHLPPNVHLISHVHPKGALYRPAPPKAAKARGPARKKGDRLPGMAAWAEDAKRPWS